MSREPPLQLEWHNGECQIRLLSASEENSIGVPLPKSVFRAILARLAALCNERVPDSVTPYGGTGEVSVGTNTNPLGVFRVTFVNTPSEQRFEVRHLAEKIANATTDRFQLPAV